MSLEKLDEKASEEGTLDLKQLVSPSRACIVINAVFAKHHK